VPIKNVDDVLKLMKNYDTFYQILPYLSKVLCTMLVIPVSSYTYI